MNLSIFLAGIAAIGLPAFGQIPAAHPLAHVSTSFDFVVHAPYGKAAPLFGAEAERTWAGKHWNPEFIHPQPATDIEGAVFTIQHGPLKATWVNTLFDMQARRAQYVYFLPGLMVTVIDIRFNPADANSTAVNVVYTRTALSEEGNEHVMAMSTGDKSSGSEWQKAINDYLGTVNSSSKP